MLGTGRSNWSATALVAAWAALAGCGCLGGGGFVLERSWSRPARIQAAEGSEICVDVETGRPRKPTRLFLEIGVLDEAGRPVRSSLPVLADEQGHLVLHRQLLAERRPQQRGPLCTFLPREALPDPAGRYAAEVVLRDVQGKALSYQRPSELLFEALPSPEQGQGARVGVPTPPAPQQRRDAGGPDGT